MPSMDLIILLNVMNYLKVLIVVCGSLVLHFLVQLYRVRSSVAKLQMQGLVGKHNISFFLFLKMICASKIRWQV